MGFVFLEHFVLVMCQSRLVTGVRAVMPLLLMIKRKVDA